jgi:hypothetical protein
MQSLCNNTVQGCEPRQGLGPVFVLFFPESSKRTALTFIISFNQRKRARLAHHHVFFLLLSLSLVQTLSSGQFKNSIILQ